MNPRRLVMASALAIPALLLPLSSCSDSNENPAAPHVPNMATPSTPSAGMRVINPQKIRLPQPSAAQVAEAVRADLAADAVTTTTIGPRARHDPTVAGMQVQCVDGVDFGFPSGTSDPFRTDHGCELNTLAGGAAIALPVSNQTRGKRVGNVRRLEFYYAGGPQNGGAPRFSLFTDFCRDAGGVPVTSSNPSTPCTTDGTWDETLFIDVSGCNDGDPYVGALLLKSIPNSKSDLSCPVFETYGPDGLQATGDEHVHTNWFDYIGTHLKDKFARNLGSPSQPADNFIIADVPVHYLVYRIRMQGGAT